MSRQIREFPCIGGTDLWPTVRAAPAKATVRTCVDGCGDTFGGDSGALTDLGDDVGRVSGDNTEDDLVVGHGEGQQQLHRCAIGRPRRHHLIKGDAADLESVGNEVGAVPLHEKTRHPQSRHTHL
jgi:hypothetical protein